MTEQPSWHALAADEVLRRLGAHTRGLTDVEAARRRAEYGRNELEPAPPVSPWQILVEQFQSVVVLLLVVAAILATALGDIPEAVAIAAVLVLNAAIGFLVELRARRAMEALLDYAVPTSTVLRDGAAMKIPAVELVPGDIIVLEAGESVPADARVLEAWDATVAEAALTGEFSPVDKDEGAVPEDTVLAERACMVYTGTGVARGRLHAVVVATGPRTELGRIGAMVASIQDEETPLEERLDTLGRRLVWVTLGVAALVAAVGWIQGLPPRQMVETAIALAIAAVPEGLPAVATISLAVGLRRMARRNALVRRLSAVEALGGATVICADKTGTLTSGAMTVTQVASRSLNIRVTGAGYEPRGHFENPDGATVSPGEDRELARVLEAAALTAGGSLDHETGRPLGDPTDAALLVLGLKGGMDPERLERDRPEVKAVPFSEDRPLTATLRRPSAAADSRDGPVEVWVKGAPDEVLSRCALEPAATAELKELNQHMAAEGLRVIALAGKAEAGAEPLRELDFLGFAGITDPPAQGVKETVATLHDAGIRTVMITGDQALTARAIAGQLGMLEGGAEVVEGKTLQALQEDELQREVTRAGAFSRTTPGNKLDIISALQGHGEVVAMLGDGVNDAPALKKADVGVAMGQRGTDAARETADVVLQDDRFATIGEAVREGRVIFDNIRKFVFYLFSCNLAEVMVLLTAGVMGLPLPLLPLQILWLNLVTDTFPALALAMEPAEPGIMARPPRPPGAGILTRSFLGSLLFFGTLITAATLGIFVWILQGPDPSRANTLAFMTLALAQLFHLGNARSHAPVLRPSRIVANPWALASVPLVLGLQLAAVYWAPLQELLRTVPLSPADWAVVIPASLATALVGQAIRVLRPRRDGG